MRQLKMIHNEVYALRENIKNAKINLEYLKKFLEDYDWDEVIKLNPNNDQWRNFVEDGESYYEFLDRVTKRYFFDRNLNTCNKGNYGFFLDKYSCEYKDYLSKLYDESPEFRLMNMVRHLGFGLHWSAWDKNRINRIELKYAEYGSPKIGDGTHGDFGTRSAAVLLGILGYNVPHVSISYPEGHGTNILSENGIIRSNRNLIPVTPHIREVLDDFNNMEVLFEDLNVAGVEDWFISTHLYRKPFELDNFYFVKLIPNLDPFRSYDYIYYNDSLDHDIE